MSDGLFDTLRACALEIGASVQNHRGRGFSGRRLTQYHLDLVADEIAVRVLGGAGYRVVSEESGVSGDGDFTVVVDPIDGSTNCDHGIPFFATSLAVMRDERLVAGLVMNHATGSLYEAERGAGAYRDGEVIHTGSQRDFSQAIVSFSGLPDRCLGWAQSRALGAASLEICLVADGSLDAYTVAQHSTLSPWDYLAGLIISREAGAVSSDLLGEQLETSALVARRPLFAATDELLNALLDIGPL
ncbi:MAG TPA: inositol monophosphatase family protein [Acidimicrobiales bacterium]|nr:inositol monophosphatase family protein [Acidimicrobiales bacterium]